ncbi:hypothetical protein M0R04_00400 [Candidatus Dojkabacteria bacterium]|jgi:hypothetical protein|nr:hypothetical protein [Candidatus Dojkabacteria bacterium]
MNNFINIAMKKKMLIGAVLTFTLILFSLIIIYLYKQKDKIQENILDNKFEVVYAKYPTLRTFNPEKLFAGGTISSLNENGDYYIAFITYGSGVPIIDARCFKINSENVLSETKYTKDVKRAQDQFDIKECK